MNFRMILALLVLVAGLVALVLLTGEEERESTGPARLFPDVAPSRVERLTFITPAGETEIRRGTDGFEVRYGDLWLPANSTLVEDILNELSRMQAGQRVPAEKVDASTRQRVATPRGKVAFVVDGERQEIHFGDPGLARGTTWATTGEEGDVFLVPDSVLEAIYEAGPDDLRRRRVLDWSVGDISAFRIVRRGETILWAERENWEYMAREPFTGHLDARVMEGSLLPAILRLQSDRVIPEPESLEPFGLDTPWFRVELVKTRGENETAILEVGDAVPDREGAWFFRREGAPWVFEGDLRPVLGRLEGDLTTFLDPNLTRIAFLPVGRIEMREGEDQFVLENDGRHWRVLEPEDLPLDPAAVDRWLDVVRELQAAEIRTDPDLADLGLDAPRGEVAFFARADQVEEGLAKPLVTRLFLGRPEGEGIWVFREGEPRTAFLSNPDLPRLLEAGPWPLRALEVFPGVSGRVVGIERRGGAAPVSLAREETGWPESVNPIVTDAMGDRLVSLRAMRWVGPLHSLEEEAELGGAAELFVAVTIEEEEGRRRRLGIEIGRPVSPAENAPRYAVPVVDDRRGSGVFLLLAEDYRRLTFSLDR